ncbi:DNA photolyase family protein [Candidatus Woesearchaeota archaeon]|nr:DNA photolyase family protein [Candidatus Woesearchaeota archaeon]
MHTKSIFIFRRDLRLEDNTALIKALKETKEVIPIFIFSEEQIKNNEYKSNNAIQFMINSLKELKEEIEQKNGYLNILNGNQYEIIKKILRETKAQTIYQNKDYTPYSKKRDEQIKKICEETNTRLILCTDYVLNSPEEILKENKQPYTIFTPYYRKAIQKETKKPEKTKNKNYSKIKLKETINIKELKYEKNPNIKLKGGRKEALKILNNIKNYNNYKQEKDIPIKDATTHLSAHIKFGTISIRETYHKIKKEFGITHELIRQLIWRDFFTQIAHYFPYVFEKSFRKKYDKIKWENNEQKFTSWKKGETGYPIIDAGMKELNKTGYMHNRTRMIVASFLIKDLRINWQWGEKYFAQKLIDYDPSINNGNWQWAASTGCDSQPYFRIFNPTLQQQKFDPECKYIKKWIPELKELTPKQIHKLTERIKLKKEHNQTQYPDPIIDHYKEKEKTLNMYKSIE